MPKLKNITKYYGKLMVFENFNLDIAEGKSTVIMGISGVGKTTLLHLLAGIEGCSGEVECTLPISYVFQTPRLIEHLTVFENLTYVLKNSGIEREKYEQEILNALQLAGLLDKKNTPCCNLSGGQKQRVGLLRAFLYPSKTMLLDEPFNSLDVLLKVRLIDLYRDLMRKNPRTAVFVSHDVDEALLIADEIIVLGHNCELERIYLPAFENTRDLSNEVFVSARKRIYDALLKSEYKN